MDGEAADSQLAVASDAVHLDRWFELSSVGLILVDSALRVVRENAAVMRISGRTAPELLAEGVVARALLRCRAGASTEPVLLSRPGEPLRRISLALVDLGAVVAVSVLPVSDHHIVQESLELALEGTATGTWLWDVGTDTVAWSPNLGPLHGLERGAAPATFAEWAAGLHPEDRDRVVARVRSALDRAEDFSIEFRAGAGDRVQWLHSRGHVVREPGNGPVQAIVGLTLDISDRRRREEAAARAARRLRDLQSVTDVALTHLELDALLAELLRRVAQLLDSDVAKVLLFDTDQRVLTVRASLGLRESVARELRVSEGAGIAGRIAAAGRPMAFADLGEEDVVLTDLRQPGRALAGVPLRLDGETLGVLTVSSMDRPYDDEDLVLLELVADRAARAIRQAELYEEARAAALSLQRSLLPAALPTVPGLDVAARYLPGQQGAEVGGDWYDLFSLPDGRLAIVVGDVVGRGLRAAARMGRVRAALRAYAFESATPADAVTRLDRLVAAEDPIEFTTLLVAFLDPRTGHVRACSAGHLPPLMADAHGAATVVVAGGPPIGLVDGGRGETTLQLAPGATLIAYTDGLVERRDRGLDAGMAALCEVAAGGGDAQSLVDRIVTGLQDSSGIDDDVAIVAVARVPTRMQRSLPAEPESVARLRHEVTAFAAAHGVEPRWLEDVALAVSEACTNVVIHAYRDCERGPIHVAARHEDGELEVVVGDEGGGVRPRGDSPGVGLGLQVIGAATAQFEVRDRTGGGAELVLRFPGWRLP